MFSKLILVCCAIIICQPLLCQSDVLIGVRLLSYKNRDGRLSDGRCCDQESEETPSQCPPDLCDTVFELSFIVHPEAYSTTFAPVMNNNSFEVGEYIGNGDISTRSSYSSTFDAKTETMMFTIKALEKSEDIFSKIASFTTSIDWVDTNFRYPPDWKRHEFSTEDHSVTIKVDLFSMCKRGWTGQKCTEKVVELPDPGAQPPQSPAKCITEEDCKIEPSSTEPSPQEKTTESTADTVDPSYANITEPLEPIDKDIDTTLEPRDTNITKTLDPIDTEIDTAQEPRDTYKLITKTLDPIDTEIDSTLEPSDTNITKKLDPIDTEIDTTLEPSDTNITKTLDPIDTEFKSTEEPSNTNITKALEPIDTELKSTEEPSNKNITKTSEPVNTKINTTLEETDTKTNATTQEPLEYKTAPTTSEPFETKLNTTTETVTEIGKMPVWLIPGIKIWLDRNQLWIILGTVVTLCLIVTVVFVAVCKKRRRPKVKAKHDYISDTMPIAAFSNPLAESTYAGQEYSSTSFSRFGDHHETLENKNIVEDHYASIEIHNPCFTDDETVTDWRAMARKMSPSPRRSRVKRVEIE